MTFTKINIQKWNRFENYKWFTVNNKCSITMTVNINITELLKEIKKLKLRCYSTFTYMVSQIINQNDEFKMGYDQEHNLGI